MSEVPTSWPVVTRLDDSQNETEARAAAWLARYVALGGGYTVQENRVSLGWSMDLDHERLVELCAHVRSLRKLPAMRDAVVARLTAAPAGRA